MFEFPQPKRLDSGDKDSKDDDDDDDDDDDLNLGRMTTPKRGTEMRKSICEGLSFH